MKTKLILFIALSIAFFSTGCQQVKSIPQPKNGGTGSPPIQEEIVHTDTTERKPLSFSLDIDGKTLSFPMEYNAFLEYGFTTSSTLPTELVPRKVSADIPYEIDNFVLYPQVMNATLENTSYEGCTVAGIIINSSSNKELASSVTYLDDIILGESTEKEIREVLGEPNDVLESKDEILYNYEQGGYNAVLLKLDAKTSILKEIDIHVFSPDTETPAPTVTPEEPLQTREYQVPTELGDDLLSGNVSFADALYHLPAPVSAFLENDWVITSSDYKTESQNNLVAAMGNANIVLTKDDAQFSATVTNYGSKAAVLEDCTIDSLTSDSDMDGISMQLPGDFTSDISKNQLEKLLEEYPYELEETDETLTYSVENESLRVQFVSHKKTETVTLIHLQYLMNSK